MVATRIVNLDIFDGVLKQLLETQNITDFVIFTGKTVLMEN